MRKSLRSGINFSAIAAICLFFFAAAYISALPVDAARPMQSWVERSNENAQVLLQVLAKFNPETAAQLGVDGFDDQIVDLKLGVQERSKQAVQQAIQTLKSRLASEKDPLVKQDLEILLKAAEDDVKEIELNEKYDLPYFNMSRAIFAGIRALLDDQIPANRREVALIRLKRYAGAEPGYTPITVLAEQRVRERFNTPGLLGPIRAEVEHDLSDSGFFVDGVAKLFQKYSIQGYEDLLAKLKDQIAVYNEFVRKELLPKSRIDFRLPKPEYEFALEQVGIDLPAEELAKQARASFTEIQKEMEALAPQVAKEKGFQVTDYRDVIHELKKNQLVGDAILPHYQNRIKQIEAIIQQQHLITLPAREMRIRLASEAESAAIPAPNMRPPRLLGNTGEMGEFVLPLNIPSPPGSKEAMQKFDDFTFDAASWTLTAHEGRPGHELQFAAMIERGVSAARAIFAFNSVNVEGWGLYAEALMQPYEPVDGQLITLRSRLLRAARAFLDPELQLGKITPEEAKRILMNDVVLSEAMANQEVERYTFRAPGQAPSYFYGYTQLTKLRKEVETKLGSKFNQEKFHDFILDQGLLPPALLRKAVLEQFLG